MAHRWVKLLLEQVHRGRLEEPFNVQPPDGPLQTLPAWAAPQLRNGSATHVRQPSDSADGRPAAVVNSGNHISMARGTPAAGRCIRAVQLGRLELETQLGAARERTAELEWRLSTAHAMLKRQHGELRAALAACEQVGIAIGVIQERHSPMA
jgi:hypothetical protein